MFEFYLVERGRKRHFPIHQTPLGKLSGKQRINALVSIFNFDSMTLVLDCLIRFYPFHQAAEKTKVLKRSCGATKLKSNGQ